MAHFGKLREDERLFALLLDGGEKVQEHLHLAGFELVRLLGRGCGGIVDQDFTGWGFAPPFGLGRDTRL